MIRLAIFLFGFAMFLIGASNNLTWMPTLIDCKSITWSLGLVKITLDVVLMVAGIFFIVVAWVFHKLHSLD